MMINFFLNGIDHIKTKPPKRLNIWGVIEKSG